jgi:hypothetical protein
MSRIPTTSWLALPMLGYVAGIALVALRGWSFLAIFEMVAIAAPAAVWVTESARLPSASLSFTAAGLAFVALGILGPSSTLVRQMLAGLLAGLPLAFSAVIALLARRPAVGVLATLAGGTIALGLRQAIAEDPGGAGSLAPSAWRTGSSQLSALSQLAHGSPSVYLPLSSVDDPAFLLLVLLALVSALVGVLLSALSATDDRPGRAEFAIRPPWVELFPSVLAATIAAAGVDVIAVASPRMTLLLISASALVVVAIILILARDQSRAAAPPRGDSVQA